MGKMLINILFFDLDALFVLNPVYPAADIEDSLSMGGDDTGSWVAVLLNMLQDLAFYLDIQSGGSLIQK